MEIDDLYNFYRVAVKGIDENLLKHVDTWYNYVMSLPVHLQAVYTIVVFHMQVFNGGLDQYFINRYGLFAYETISNLEKIGAVHTKEILSRAVDKINYNSYGVEEFRSKIFNNEIELLSSYDAEMADYLDKLDDEYYALEEDVHQLLVDYLVKEGFN